MKYRNGLKTKQNIVDEAFHLFAQQGYEATSIDQIMKRLGRTKGTFYAHFRSKEELFVEIMNQRMRSQHRMIEKEWHEYEDKENGWRFVEEMIQKLIKYAQAEDWISMFFEFVAHVEKNPDVRAHMLQMYEEWRSFLSRFFAMFQEKGLLKKEIDPTLLATSLIAVFDGFNLQYHVNQKIDPFRQIEFIRHFFTN